MRLTPIGPLLAASAVGNVLASRAPAHLRRPARTASSIGAVGVAVEVFAWMTKHPRHPLAKALARPGHELQHRLATEEPRPSSSRSPRRRSQPAWSSSMATGQESRPRRLPPEIFDLPVEKMREGYYTDAYFNHTRETLLRDGRHPRVVMQVFQRNHAMLGGIDEAIAILKLCSNDWEALTVHALHDGDRIEAWETALTIEGDYTLFAHLETVYLGVLTRRTLITTNTARVVEAANGKPIIFMPARHDHHRVQTGDGYAGYVAGAMVGAEIGVTSDAQASWWGGRGVGTVPHSLIASYGGNTVLAATKFAEWASEDMNIVVLVDFENDSVRTALEVARTLAPALGRPPGHVRAARRPLALERDGRLRPARRQRAPRPQGAGGARRGRVRAGPDRRLGRLHSRQDRAVRAPRRAGRRVRNRLVADPRPE